MPKAEISNLEPGDMFTIPGIQMTGIVYENYGNGKVAVVFPGWSAGHSIGGLLTGEDEHSGWVLTGGLMVDVDNEPSAPAYIVPEVLDDMF